MTKCDHCSGNMAILPAITNRSEVGRYLKQFGIELESQSSAPLRFYEEPFLFGSIEDQYESIITIDD